MFDLWAIVKKQWKIILIMLSIIIVVSYVLGALTGSGIQKSVDKYTLKKMIEEEKN